MAGYLGLLLNTDSVLTRHLLCQTLVLTLEFKSWEYTVSPLGEYLLEEGKGEMLYTK